MADEEALIRAREACAADAPNAQFARDYRNGCFDHSTQVLAAKRALLDLDKPLPVDRDLADLRELFAQKAECLRYTDVARFYRDGGRDNEIKCILPTFRAIIQRRIDEVQA